MKTFYCPVIKKKTPKELDEKFKNLLFTTKFGTPINAQIESDAIKVILDGINLIRDDLEQIEGFSGHTFRHTFASNCYQNGFDLKSIQKLLGHATVQMTANLYVHIFEKTLVQNMDRLSDAMEKLENTDEIEDTEQRFRELVENREKNRKKIVNF